MARSLVEPHPSLESGGSISELVAQGLLSAECERVFRVKTHKDDPGTAPLTLHRHQREAVEVARSGKSYVLTTGTGSGKSLAYIVPIVDSVLRERLGKGGQRTPGVKAIVVYPMNALANSQVYELRKFLEFGYPPGAPPVRFARYTGQEEEDTRKQILADPPDILLTNYVMLELVLTRPDERRHLIRAAQDLRFLVLDELHTYRGRQGADVALLIRRLRDVCASPDLQVIGTSATMASGGTSEEQKSTVAEVASRLFGSEVTPQRVIGETLNRATTQTGMSEAHLRDSIAAALGRTGIADYEQLAHNPLAQWIEETFGLDIEHATGRLVRSRPTSVTTAAAQLAELSGTTPVDASQAIRRTLMLGSQTKDPLSGRPLFAFRLHQFLSKGDTVYVSLEPESSRYITSTYQQRVPGQPDKSLLPLGFCRECGQDYLVVSRVNRQGQTTFVPRQDADASGGDSVTGYIYVSEDLPWPANPIAESRLPDHWLATSDSGETTVLPNKAKYLPEEIWLSPDGTLAHDRDGLQCWFVSTPFAFCMRCRVSYEQVRGNDYAKLATLDREGRSSAVTVVSASIVRSLKALAPEESGAEARKLLTFVDNRQDASLQAGHFNDFVQVAQLRGGLYRAMSESPVGITHEVLAQRVTEALRLTMHDVAANPLAKFSARDQAFRALRQGVEYRLYADLQRGFRITMPNLEQTGLLRVEYVDLPEIARDHESWAECLPVLREADPALREELSGILLDELRRVLAVDVDCLTEIGFERIQRESRQHLAGPWSLPEGERVADTGTAYARPGRPGRPRGDQPVRPAQRRADLRPWRFRRVAVWPGGHVAWTLANPEHHDLR